ncbi:uncharacterized protein [Dermacentor andersoni]|uniref:uncharacterized protein n=1 Tax=Dermacentor andersoni TaxID=34620 RepID=UPI0024162E64|nr:uncharacterized protein LOC129382762 [Dermacentor andersoni]
MASVWLLLAALCALGARCRVSTVGLAAEASSFRRPDLAHYQDAKKCASPGATWYVLYRNMKQGAFGAHDSCLRDTQMSKVVDGKGLFRVRYDNGHERNATFTFKSSDGRNYNIFQVQLDGVSGVGMYDMLFVDCAHCRIVKDQKGPKCLLSVRESSLRHGVPRHCHFLYDLLCGTSPKYQVSDSSCLHKGPKLG